MPGWRLSPTADDDLDEILDFIAEQSQSIDVALRVLNDFETEFERLSLHPEIGRRKLELTGSDFRWWRVHRYEVVYDPTSKPLRVVRVVHSARDLPRVLDTL